MPNVHPNKRIAIIGGTGDQGKGLALRWAQAGFDIIVGSRAAERASDAAKEMKEILAKAGFTDAAVSGAHNTEAAASSSLVVLTVPFAAQIATLKEIRDKLPSGSILIDVTVPLEPAVGGKPTRVLGVWAGSAAEQCKEQVPDTVTVVSAFHNVGAESLIDLSHEVECDVIVCGDKKEAKEAVRPLVDAIRGCRFVDGGPLANSRTVEAITALLIGINIRYKGHTGIRITGI
ncbi:MAG: NADPH-dependent F420 reductase [Acidobacteria bacterium]|nr:NADPH-dependent F420 reductase [Acidobacteriota bacterium]